MTTATDTDTFTVVEDHDISAHGGWHDDEREITQSVTLSSPDGRIAIIVAEINYPNQWDDELLDAAIAKIAGLAL